jgi:hypothetical protein
MKMEKRKEEKKILKKEKKDKWNTRKEKGKKK